MKNAFPIILFAIGILIGAFIGFNLHPKAPEVGTGSTVAVTQPKPQHDTIPGKDVLVYRQAKPVHDTLRDTLHRVDTVTVAAVRESATCWSWEKRYPDGTAIKAGVCSDSLPAHKPLDGLFTIDYTPKPDSVRTITKSVVYKPSTWENVRNYGTVSVVGIAVGVIAGMVIKSNIR